MAQSVELHMHEDLRFVLKHPREKLDVVVCTISAWRRQKWGHP